MQYKRDLLDILWRNAGPAALLSIGQGIRDIEFDPMWRGAMRAANPAVLLDKWRRVEVFGHSRNRVRVNMASETQVSFHRYSVDGQIPPTTPENLLICGVTIALLEEIGCLGLHCDMPAGDGSNLRIYDKARIQIPDQAGLTAASWDIGWREFTARPREEAEPDPLPVALPASCDARTRASIEAASILMAEDAARQWKLGELARECGMSSRSMQRRLEEGGLSFSKLVRLVRIREACRLLKDSDASITMIGFCAGFSDSAQFSRDFRSSTGMTPSDYRAVI